MADVREGMSASLDLEGANVMPKPRSASPPDGTTKHSTKPASEQVAGKPPPSHPQGVRRRDPAASQRPFRSPSRGRGLA